MLYFLNKICEKSLLYFAYVFRCLNTFQIHLNTVDIQCISCVLAKQYTSELPVIYIYENVFAQSQISDKGLITEDLKAMGMLYFVS